MCHGRRETASFKSPPITLRRHLAIAAGFTALPVPVFSRTVTSEQHPSDASYSLRSVLKGKPPLQWSGSFGAPFKTRPERYAASAAVSCDARYSGSVSGFSALDMLLDLLLDFNRQTSIRNPSGEVRKDHHFCVPDCVRLCPKIADSAETYWRQRKAATVVAACFRLSPQ